MNGKTHESLCSLYCLEHYCRFTNMGFFDCVCDRPLWKRNPVIYFFDGQSWMWINIWSIHCDQPSRGVLEAAPEFLFNQPTNTQSRSGLFGSWPQITEFWTDLAGCGQQPLAWVPLKLFKLLSPLSWVWGFWHFKTVKMQKLKFSGCCHVLAGRWQAWSIGVFPQLHLEATPRLHGQQHVTNTHVPITALAYTSSVFAFHWQSWFLVILKSNFFLGV